MSEPKFKDTPWHIDKTEDELWGEEVWYRTEYYSVVSSTGETIVSDIINKEAAELMVCAPDLYASEEKNLELLKIPYHAFQYMLALCKADVKMQTFVNDQLKVKFEDIEKFAKEYEERIAETEQLLKKARGEECQGT